MDFEPIGAGGEAFTSREDQDPPVCEGQACATGEICRPGFGCEAACDVAGGLDENAPWPLGGGCATRRGLSRFAGAKSPHELWHLDAGGEPEPYASAITLGAGHTIYTPFYDANQRQFGFLQLSATGHPLHRFGDLPGQCPLVASGGVLYTMPGSLVALSVKGKRLWQSLYGQDQSGEPVVGNDGTLYVVGTVAVNGGIPALYALGSSGSELWHYPIWSSFPLSTSPAVAPSGTIYLGDGEDTLYAVSAEGKSLWHVPRAGSQPIVDPDGNVLSATSSVVSSFTSSGELRFQIAAPNARNFHFQQLAIGPDRSMYISYRSSLGGDDSEPQSGVLAYTAAGDLEWQFSKPDFGATAPVVDRDGVIYVGIQSHMYAVKPDGSELWSYENSNGLAAAGVAIGADGTTYLAFQQRLVALRDD